MAPSPRRGFVIPVEYNTAVVLLGTAALGLAAGSTGSLALLRGRALLSDALAHATLPGICLAFLLTGSRSHPALLLGALATGALGVVLVAALSRRGRIKEDAAIGAVLACFFGAGSALSGAIQRRSPDAAQAGLDGFLLGQPAGMLLSEALTIAGVAVATLLLVALLAKEWKLVCFDPDFAAIEGWPVRLLDLLLMLLITTTVVLALPAVGVVLAAAILIIPATAARLWVDRLVPMLILASSFGVLASVTGTLLSARFPALPTGPLIVLAAGCLFLISLLVSPRRGIVARATAERRRRRERERRRLLGTIFTEQEAAPESPVSEGALARRRVWGPGRLRAHLEDARRRGWIRWGPRGIELTDAGRQRAARIVRASRIWEQYLLSQAQIDRDLIDLDAEEIGHLLPPHLVAELERSLADRGLLPLGSEGSPA
ncbi:MAG: iron chelate uptake ABC transporter family permease subunit [Planctomycetota bacterium]